MNQKFIVIIDIDDEATIIPLDNISHISRYEGITRIYLRHVAGTTAGILWYVLSNVSVQGIADLIDEANR